MSLLIPIAVFVGVASLVGGIVLLLRGRTEEAMATRLAQLTGSRRGKEQRPDAKRAVPAA